MEMSREKIINDIIRLIEKTFSEVLVIHTGIALSEEDYDEPEEFEVLGLKDEDYRDFRKLKWEIRDYYENEYGYTFVFHALSPEATKKHRWDIYQRELAKRPQPSQPTYSAEFVISEPSNAIATELAGINSGTNGHKVDNFACDIEITLERGNPAKWSDSIDLELKDVDQNFANAA